MRKKQEYIFRYYLPVKPYFDEEYTKKRFNELIAFCKETETNAVMFYVSLSPDFYYMPDTIENSLQVREQMLPYIKKLKEAGISYQLNFQNLFGQTLGGVDFSSRYDWEYLVDYKGKTALGCGCPLGKKFREQSEARLKIWAETDPDIIWMDDDFRMHNHGTPVFAMRDDGSCSYVDHYCFCENHIRLFNERNKTNYNRETLVEEILSLGKVSSTREKYLDFLNETMAETASWVEKTVHAANPRTRLAQMTSYPDVHAAEGRKWEEFLPALCGEYSPIVRAHFGPYMEHASRGFIDAYRKLNQTIVQLGENYKGRIEYCPEIENTRFTVWAKSVVATSFQLAVSAFMGCSAITLSLYDLDGGALFDEPKYKQMMIEQKPFLDELVDLNLLNAKTLGVKIPTSSESGKRYCLKSGEGYDEMGGSGRYIENYLLTMGIPCVYVTEEDLYGDGIVALDSFTASYLTNEQLLKLFKGNLFIDGGAAEILIERGFGGYIGVERGGKQSCIVNAEVIKTFTREDGTYIRIPSRMPVNCWYNFKHNANTKIYSQLLTPDGREFAGLTMFKNIFGGRVVVYPAKENWGDGFYTHYRVKLVKDVFAELSENLPRMDTGSAVLSVVKETKEGNKYYLCANLASDCVENITINGNIIKESLNIYQTAVYLEKDGAFIKIGKTR